MLNATAASVLGFLDAGPRTGWELTQAIEDSIGNFWNVTRSQVYRELASLAADGLVEAGDRGPRDRRPYSVTPSGRQAFVDWINREPGDELIRMPLLLTIFFREHVAPERLATFLHAHRQRHQACLDEFLAIAGELGSTPSGPLDALRFGIAYEREMLRWIDEMLASAGQGAAATGSAGSPT
jgi:DNA-binding PadR family transcriptional regulator